MQGNMLCLSNFFLISLCLEDYIFGVFFLLVSLGFFLYLLPFSSHFC